MFEYILNDDDHESWIMNHCYMLYVSLSCNFILVSLVLYVKWDAIWSLLITIIKDQFSSLSKVKKTDVKVEAEVIAVELQLNLNKALHQGHPDQFWSRHVKPDQKGQKPICFGSDPNIASQKLHFTILLILILIILFYYYHNNNYDYDGSFIKEQLVII